MNSYTKLTLILFFAFINIHKTDSFLSENSETDCRADLVETIPMGLSFNSTIKSKSTFDVLIRLVSGASQTIDIASFYWTLLETDGMPNPDGSGLKGKQLLNAIIESSKSGSVRTRIAVNANTERLVGTDLGRLRAVADVRELNFTRLNGAGILHTKFIIVDNKHFYLGSANMDWRSLTHVKELGVVLNECPLLANDLSKIFEIYWYLGKAKATVPKRWPNQWRTDYNQSNPLSMSLNKIKGKVFLSSSPKAFCPSGRTADIEAILSIIRRAKKFIDIAVMDYYPIFLYTKYKAFWPVIDDALKTAVIERRVNVRFLASRWNRTYESMPIFLKSLAAFNETEIFGAKLEIKVFVVPALTPFQREIPHARVNHNKYMVTDETAYIGTSNWAPDYIVNSGGVGIAITPGANRRQSDLKNQLEAIFERDWHSSYAQHL